MLTLPHSHDLEGLRWGLPEIVLDASDEPFLSGRGPLIPGSAGSAVRRAARATTTWIEARLEATTMASLRIVAPARG